MSSPLSNPNQNDLVESRGTASAEPKKSRPASEDPAMEKKQEPSISIVTGTNKKVRRSMPPWLMSLILHAVILLLLGFSTLAMRQKKQDDLHWIARTPAYEEIDIFQEIEEIEIDLLEDFESFDVDPALEPIALETAVVDDLSSELVLASATTDVAPITDSLSDLGSLLGHVDGGLSEPGLGKVPTASFFGTKVEGKRILYMLDNSGGMKKGKLETLVKELLKSVDSLQRKQQFYVIFYSDTVYPLFYPRSATNFVRATAKNKEFLREWLETVELCLGNSIDEALEAANVIRPDTVFLLTDGRLFTTDAKERILLDSASREFPINTFGMGVKANSSPARELQSVADANRGTYRTVQVSPEAKVLAKERARPYRNDQPGVVWGRSLAR